MKNGLIVDKHGTKRWYQDNQLHNENAPAIQYRNGDRFWLKNNLIHRDGGPAIEYDFVNRYGLRFDDYFDELYKILRRVMNLNIFFNSDFYLYKAWVKNGKFHRDDGPAIECFDKSQYWFYDNKHVKCSSQTEFDKLIKLKAFW